MGEQRNRIPRLSKKPEGKKGRYYAAYQDEHGKSRRKRFTRDRAESHRAYPLWIAERYNPDLEIIQRDTEDGKAIEDLSLLTITEAYLEREKRRVREYGTDARRGTITRQTYDGMQREVLIITAWAKENPGPRFRTRGFGRLFTVTDYENMFLCVTNRWGNASVNKLQTRFWAVVRFAAREPYRVRLTFSRDEVPSYGGDERFDGQLPTVSDLRRILKAAKLRERVWIWLALGCGFGPQDIAECRPVHFDEHNFDLRRAKTGVDRFGPMFPMVWSHLQLYVAECPSKPNDLLFRSRNGKPIVWRDKKKPGAEQGRSSYTKSSALRMAWVRLLKRSKANWSGRFYTLRSLGGTSFGSRPDVSIVALRDFMGHKSINTTNRYLRAVTPRNRRLVEWITRTLDKDNPEAWRESVK